MSTINEKLKVLNLNLPSLPKPAGLYLPALQVGLLVFTSGILPYGKDGSIAYTQQIDNSSIDDGREATHCALLNALAVLKDTLGGDLDNIERIVKLTGYVNSQTGFCQQPQVINAASEILINIWGEKGKHVRTAIGVNELPFGSSVELELIVQVKKV
ncbi:MAG: RidA family protein [Candidatus Caenarcaniphilales bacterium]|nr:RidA family protein [Candidatus Caenarcaniphilales bacterium]